MRISDWSSDVCSSDLGDRVPGLQRFLRRHAAVAVPVHVLRFDAGGERQARVPRVARVQDQQREHAEQQLAPQRDSRWPAGGLHAQSTRRIFAPSRSEEHTSELQSLMRSSYAVFCLKKKITNT